ncbi:sensor histidine kinase [Neorickettsia sennetsu]|uniref:histidine kinase n=1 Tax=Ehrlichia sennetsu (strain ATCC VR-367 / Miyayama) TaxID=222891 RepID=Q2GF07_EHRS3|nr:HAMP domain-containing sensor histidine kinase [Neorickettsia sennetsu]ABD46187.1 sensor histidine kinase [Neorickettsia sennetsu str. Miyayama]
MFNYIKSFILIVVTILLTSFLGYIKTEKTLLESSTERNAVNIRNIFNRLIWEKYSFMLEMYDFEPTKMYEKPQFMYFESEAKLLFEPLDVIQVEIFYKGETRVFSLNKYLEHAHHPYNHDLNNNISSTSIDNAGNIVVTVALNPEENPPSVIEITYDAKSLIRPFRITWIGFTLVVLFICSSLFFWSVMKIRESSKVLNEQFSINTKLKKAKESIEEISSQKSQFLANVSHELKTPLNAIIGFSDLIRTAEVLGTEHREYANDIYYSGNHLLNLINDILDFSKSELNNLEIKPTLFDLVRLTETCIRMTTTKRKEIKIVKSFFSNKILIKSDHKRVKQVILNILSNSIKFTNEDGLIRISIIRLPSEIEIEISDNGVGIPEKDIAKALSVFGQSNTELSRKYDGAGIGLPLSKKLVELMGGVFEIESKEGSGTVVKIRLPYRESNAA